MINTTSIGDKFSLYSCGYWDTTQRGLYKEARDCYNDELGWPVIAHIERIYRNNIVSPLTATIQAEMGTSIVKLDEGTLVQIQRLLAGMRNG